MTVTALLLPSVLVVDDSASNTDLLNRRLVRAGFEVVVAPDGYEALELIDQRPFDLVLLDVMMPGLSGLEVLERIRGGHSRADLPVIMTTALSDAADIEAALQSGANDYVTKPIDFRVLLARIEGQLEHHRAMDHIRELERFLDERNILLEQTNRELMNVQQRMRRDLEAAAHIQQSLLPVHLAPIPGVEFAWRFRPCDELGGDLLNIVPLTDNEIGLYCLDVSGHGVGSALLTMALHKVLSGSGPTSLLVHAGSSGTTVVAPAEVLNELNRLFPMAEETMQYFTLCYGVLDLRTRAFRFASAGHPFPIVHPLGGVPYQLQGSGYPIGISEESDFDESVITLSAGDRLFLLSDGFAEAHAPGRRLLGDAQVIEALGEGGPLSLRASLDGLVALAEEWCGNAGPRDDMTVLGVEMG